MRFSWLTSSILFSSWFSYWVFAASLVSHDETFIPDHILHVTAQDISQACDTRYSVVVNGTSPGPTIRLKAGKPAWIRVYNDMLDANLTMHWHGLAQYMAEFSDGSPLASQWPIAPQEFFDYELQVPVKEAGTYFYHSHIGMQALTCTGALIVEDCGEPPYEYDEDRILLWHEHYKQTDKEFEDGLLAVPLSFGGEVVALMLDGKGVSINHTAGEIPGDTSCQLPLIEVEPDTSYRFRFIGATSLAHTLVKFEDHDDLIIIAVDGSQYTQEATTDRMQIGSGQRFDVLFRTKSSQELKALGKTDFFFQFETRDRPSVYRGYGVLRYTTSTTITTTTNNASINTNNTNNPVPAAPTTPIFNLPNITYNWMENTLQPLYPDPDFPTLNEVTRRIILNSSQLTNPTTGQVVWQINGLSWNEYISYPTPLLVDIYQRGEAAVPNYDLALANRGWDPRTRSFPAKVGEVLEIVLQNTGSLVNQNGGVDVHPFHAHGQHYYDLGSGSGLYDAEVAEAAIVQAGYTPVKRDTTMLYRYETTTVAGAPAGWRAWRIKVSDPGVWMIHCHILQHMIMGMQSVWVIGNASEIQKTPTELSSGYFTYGGSVYGNVTYYPEVCEQFDHSIDTCNA